MPANLTPQYLEAEEKYRRAQTPQDKLNALQEMLRSLPKHKGTEKIQAELKRKIAEQRKETQESKGKKKPSFQVDSYGYPQVVVLGAPNSGRSLLISQLSGAELAVGDYPFTTRTPHPAMMTYQNVRMQLVDTPPIAAGYMESWMPNIVRAADAALLVADLASDEVLENLEVVIASLKKQKVYLHPKESETEVGDIFKKTLLVANKCDVDGADEILELVDECYGKNFAWIAVSSVSKDGLSELARKIFLLLDLVRIYSKPPGKKADMSAPILLKAGSTAVELAQDIHSDLASRLKSARIWKGEGFIDGQKIPLDYPLPDEVIIELQTE